MSLLFGSAPFGEYCARAFFFRGAGGKVAGALEVGRQAQETARARRPLPHAFVSGKKEEVPALPDRASEVAAELVSLELRVGAASPIVGPAIGVQVVVAKEVERGAVKP